MPLCLSCINRKNEHECKQTAQLPGPKLGQIPNLLIAELVSTKGSHAWFDASGAQGDEEEPHHGQHSECKEDHVNYN